MSSSFLYSRITKRQPDCTGTLAEPDGAPEPRFAYQSSISWMRALCLLVESEDYSYDGLNTRYSNVQKFSSITDHATNTVFEQLLMSLHHLSALKALENIATPLDVSRIGIMSWYYGVYCASSAMLAACDGAQQGDHTGTANAFDTQIIKRSQAFYPFDLRVSTTVKKDAKIELDNLKGDITFALPNYPSSTEEARGVCISYLSGTQDYRHWLTCETLKKKELRSLNLTDFRKKEAQSLRDDRLRNKPVSFLHMAFRYRGKANYRDALFLTYQMNGIDRATQFNQDLSSVLCAFIKMAGVYCSKRVNQDLWNSFIGDIESNTNFRIGPKELWS